MACSSCGWVSHLFLQTRWRGECAASSWRQNRTDRLRVRTHSLRSPSTLAAVLSTNNSTAAYAIASRADSAWSDSRPSGRAGSTERMRTRSARRPWRDSRRAMEQVKAMLRMSTRNLDVASDALLELDARVIARRVEHPEVVESRDPDRQWDSFSGASRFAPIRRPHATAPGVVARTCTLGVAVRKRFGPPRRPPRSHARNCPRRSASAGTPDRASDRASRRRDRAATISPSPRELDFGSAAPNRQNKRVRQSPSSSA